MAEISCLGGEMAKVVCVLYDDPIVGYPESYARDEIPKLEQYPDGHVSRPRTIRAHGPKY